MNWDDLRFFLALAREGTVSGAGRLLEVKHTTVARRISAYEETLGSRLFDRTPSGYMLTQVGENLLPHAKQAEELMNSVEREVFGMDTALSGSLRLASSYDILTHLITPHIHNFTQKFPEIELSMITSTNLVDLRGREADLALRISPNPPDYLIGNKIMPLGHGVYGSVKYLKRNSEHIDLILWDSDKNKPDWVVNHFPSYKVKIRTSDIMTMVEAVKNHHGIARMPCYVADKVPSLRRLDIDLKPSSWHMWVLSHPDLRSTARVRACREFLVETIEEQRDFIEGKASQFY